MFRHAGEEEVDPGWVCNKCLKVSELGEELPSVCPNCGSSDVEFLEEDLDWDKPPPIDPEAEALFKQMTSIFEENVNQGFDQAVQSVRDWLGSGGAPPFAVDMGVLNWGNWASQNIDSPYAASLMRILPPGTERVNEADNFALELESLPTTEHPLGPHTGAQNANLQPLVTQLLSVQQMAQALANNPDADVNNAINLLNQATGLLQGVLQKPGL